MCACAQKFVEQVRAEMGTDSVVKDGKFGAMMEVNLCNDGPVTMQIEYPGMCAPLYVKASESAQFPVLESICPGSLLHPSKRR